MALSAKDKKIARKSLGEEEKAVDEYTERLRDADSPRLHRAFRHAIPEEKTHAHLFREALKK